MAKKCIEITIAGYRALVDPKGLIIDTDQKIEKLRYQRINKVFEKYKKRAVFKKKQEIPYPLMVTDDICNEMIKKNPAIATLMDKFDCEIF